MENKKNSIIGKSEINANFTIISNGVLSTGISGTAYMVYSYLSSLANNTYNQCYPSYETIANAISKCRETVIKAVKELISLNLITKERRKHRTRHKQNLSNLYTIYAPASSYIEKESSTVKVKDNQKEEDNFKIKVDKIVKNNQKRDKFSEEQINILNRVENSLNAIYEFDFSNTSAKKILSLYDKYSDVTFFGALNVVIDNQPKFKKTSHFINYFKKCLESYKNREASGTDYYNNNNNNNNKKNRIFNYSTSTLTDDVIDEFILEQINQPSTLTDNVIDEY